jgi:RNA polymerase sigma-70 factor (ECF subfamily)
VNVEGRSGQYMIMGAVMEPDGADTVASLDVRSGDPAIVFASLFDAHASGLHRYLSRRVGAVADDLVAETFMAGMANREGYDPSKADPRAWLYGIATNLLRRHFRQELRGLVATAKAAAAVSINGSDPGDEVSDQVDARARIGRLASGIAALNQDDRDVLLLTAWAGLDSIEVAQALGIPVGTVRSRLHRVRRQLRAHEASTTAPTSRSGEQTGSTQ